MACKYTYGNQVYDSLDDLKAAVKNDLQRSADKEEVVDNNNQSNTITTKSDNISYKNNPTNLNTYLNYLGLKDIALNDAIFNAPIDAISKERVFLNTLQQIVENTPVLSAVDISEYVAKDKQKDLPDLKPLAQRIHALSMALSQNPSEKDLREYVKLNTELNAKIIELLTPHIKKVFGKDASIEYKTIRSVDPLYNPSQQLNTTVKPQGIINVYWGQAESATSTKILSNLAPRKFKYKSSDGISREYGSVEHAYQTLKSGSFDQVTYDKYVRAGGYGTKITGKIANKATNLQLMKDLVVASFEQNSDSPAAKKLLQYEKFTHNTNEIIDQAFLEGLKLAQAKLLSSQQSNTTQQPKTEAKITDAEVEAMTDALVEMYPEIEFGVENNPTFVNKEGVFNQIEDSDFINLVTHDNLLTGNIVIGDSFATFTLDLKAGELKDISLAKELQGKGIGSDIYLKLNALLNRKGMVLKSSDNLSKASEALWESLYKKGYVEKTPAKIKRNYEDAIQEGVTDLSGKMDIVDGFTYKFKNNQQNIFNQRIENTNQNVDAEVLDKINSFELYENEETLCPGGICNFTAKKSTEHLIDVGLNPYPNSYNGSQLPVQVNSPMGPFKITHFVSAVAINDSIYIYDMPQNEFISDDFFGMGSDVKVKQAYKPRLIFLSLDDIQSNYNLSVEDAGNFIHSILNNRGWEGANAAPSFKEYISKNINNSEIYIKSLEDEISKSGYKMPEYFNREAYEKEVQDKRNNIINETLSKEDKDKVLNYYANKLRIKTREYLPTKTDSFSLRELVKSVIGDIEVNIDKSSFQNALSSLKEFLNSKDFIDRLLHAYEFSGTNLKNAESSISDVYSTGRLMAGFINQVKSYGIVEALTKYSPEEQYKIKGLLSTDVLTKYKSKEQAALMLQKYWSNKDNIVKRLNLGKSFDNLMLSKFRYAASHNKLKTVLNYLKFSDFDSSNIYNAIANEATRRYTYFEKKNDVQFQKEGNQIIGQADIQARKILIDAAFKNKPDLASHEFAHFYIAWFRNTPLVQQGIKMYGSEEALVQAIGEQAVVQRGKAWSWWKKFVAWLLNSANDVSDLTKENLRDILTDAFLSRQDLNKQAGTEAGVKLEKNVAVLGGETYLWNNNTGFWQPFTKSEADIEYSNDEMQRRMQKERDAKAQVKNDAVIKPAWKNNKRAALENRLLNIHKAIALHPVNAQNLLAPVSTVITKGIVKKLGIRAKHETRGAVIDPLSNINASIAMVQGKQGVGIVANAINTKAALTGVDAKLTLMYPVQSPLSTDEKHTQLPINLRMLGIEKVRYADGTLAYSLGKLVDTFGNSIISNLSESLTQQVDNVKDPVAVELGYTLKTLGLTSYILTLGVPQEILAGLTAKGGIVTAWNDRVEENENLFHKGVTETNVYQNEFGQKETNTTKFEESNSTLKIEFIAALLRKEGVPSKYIETAVDENRKVKGYLLKHEALDADNVSLDKYDAVKLLFYWELIDQARAYGNTIKALTADTKTHKSIDAAAQQQLLIDQQLAGIDSIIDKDDISKVISSRTALKSNTKSVISPFFNMQRKYIEYFSKYFYTHDNGISSYLAANLKARYKLYNGDKLNRLISTAHNDFMIYLMTRMTAVNSNATSSLAKYNIDTAPLVEANALLKHGEGLKMSAVNSIYNNLVLISKQPNLTTSQNYYYAQPASARKNSTIELYQNITPEMARSLLDIFRFELGRVIKADVNVDNNTSIYLQNIPSVDLIMFKDSAITTSAANNYIEIFEELRTKSPKLIQLFNSISLFQAGLNNSPYNLFKTLPITDLLSEDKSKSLVSNLATTIRTFDKLLPKKGTSNGDWFRRSTTIHSMVDDFLRWFDLQYGKIYVQPEAASKYNKASRLYKAFSSKDQKFIIYVKNDEGGGTPLESVSSLTKNYLSTVPYTYAPTTTAVTNSNVITNDTINEDATIKQLESLGAFGDIIKAYVAAGGEIETLCS